MFTIISILLLLSLITALLFKYRWICMIAVSYIHKKLTPVSECIISKHATILYEGIQLNIMYHSIKGRYKVLAYSDDIPFSIYTKFYDGRTYVVGLPYKPMCIQSNNIKLCITKIPNISNSTYEKNFSSDDVINLF
jgi:hypothetical protein